MSLDAIETGGATVPQTPPTALALDPATGELLGSVPIMAPSGVAEVVAQVAKVQPLWALLRLEDRARYMRRMAQAIVDEFDELREALAREQGRPRTEVAALELLAAIDALKWVAHEGASVLGGRRVGVHRSLSLTKRARIAYEPYGVVGVIGAGSAPFAQPFGQIAGALLAGNGVVGPQEVQLARGLEIFAWGARNDAFTPTRATTSRSPGSLRAPMNIQCGIPTATETTPQMRLALPRGPTLRSKPSRPASTRTLMVMEQLVRSRR